MVQAIITGNLNIPPTTEYCRNMVKNSEKGREKVPTLENLYTICHQLIFDHLCDSLFYLFTNVYFIILC